MRKLEIQTKEGHDRVTGLSHWTISSLFPYFFSVAKHVIFHYLVHLLSFTRYRRLNSVSPSLLTEPPMDGALPSYLS
jgi:hypothetical protein